MEEILKDDGAGDVVAMMQALNGDGKEDVPGEDDLAQMMRVIGGMGDAGGSGSSGEGSSGSGSGSSGEGSCGSGGSGGGGMPVMAALMKHLGGMGDPKESSMPDIAEMMKAIGGIIGGRGVGGGGVGGGGGGGGAMGNGGGLPDLSEMMKVRPLQPSPTPH